MNKAYDCEIAMTFNDDPDTVSQDEMILLRAFLPDILRELALSTYKDED